MAKFLDKDPFSYEQERTAFVNQLRQFHASKGTPFFRLPTIAGKELDLYLLYSKVVAWGGLTKVTDQGKWESLQEYFGIAATCGHAAFALRQFYVKFLESYERIHHQGEDAEEVLRSRSRPATPSSQPQKRNIDTRKGLEIPEQLRINAGLSTQKPRLSDYDKIMFSLQSGLPNEVDFAINVCTLLSNEGRHVLHLERAVKLIDLLLAHCGVFYEGPGGFRSLYTEDWKPTTKRDFVTFWYDTVTDSDIREIIGPDTLRAKAHCKIKDAEQFTVRKLGLNDIEGQRALQVAVILRNLSFEDHNKRVMAAHRTFYRFLLLCVHNSCSALQQIGMDTLSNIAEEFILDPIDYRSTQLMFHTIDKAMKNQDKFIILRAMEVVEKLSQVDSNIDIIRQCMEERVYRSVIRLLTIHDVQLLLGALEVLLALSERGEVFCTRIATLEKSVDVLVCLVTLDAQSLGAEAFVGIKIVDHAPDGIHHPIVTMARYQPMSQATPPPPQNAGTAATPPPSMRPMQQQQSTPTPPPAPAQPVNRDAENEKFTCQWLHSFYEADNDASVSRLDLYSDYLSACSKASRVNMVTSTNFATCIKMVFPAAGFQRVDSESGAQVYITGIHKRVLPLPFNWLLYQQLPKPSPNYQPQLGGPQSNLASSIMQRMAQRLSPSPGSSSSTSPQQRLFTQGMSSVGTNLMPPQMYRAGMIPGPPSGNTGSTSQLQQLILGHGLRQQNPVTQGQVGHPTSVGSTPSNQRTHPQQVVQATGSVHGAQQQVQTTHSVPSNCSTLAVQSAQPKANSVDDSDMLSPQGSLVNQAGIPSAFLQNPLPQHSQAIANNDPSKSPGRSPASPGRAPPPYRPRSPAGSGAKATTPTSSVANSTSPTPPLPASCPKLPNSSDTIPNEVLQEGEVKIEKIPNIHAQLPLDTNQVSVAFPQEGSDNFPANSIPLLQAKAAPAVFNPETSNAQQQTSLQAKPREVSTDTNATQAAGNAAVTSSQQVVNIPNQQVFITQQQLQHASGIPVNSQGIQISAQGIQINPQGMNHSQGNVIGHQQQIVTQGPQQSIQMQIPTTQVGVQQWIQAQPQVGQPNAQGIVNINGPSIVATNGLKGQPNMQIVQQGVLSGTHGIKIGALPVQTNALPVQTGFQIKQSDAQGMPPILPKTVPATQQVIVGSSAATNGGKMYSAYAVVQNVQRSVPTVLGQVTPTNPGQTGQGGSSGTSQPTTSGSGAYIPIQPKLSGHLHQQQQQQPQQQSYSVAQPQQIIHQHMVQQQQQQQQQQPQQQYILTSIQGTLPQQSFAVSTISSAPQVQQSFAVGVAAHPSTQPSTTVCSQSQSIGHVAARIQSQGQQITSAHIDSPLIKQLLQSGSSVHPPQPNQLPQPQVVNPNMQSAVQWVVPQNPSSGTAPGYGLVNIQGPMAQQCMPQPYAVNPPFTQVGHPAPLQPVMHFIPPVCTSPSPVQSPALSCSSSSSPNSTSKLYPMSPSPSPQHKSEKKSKSKSHKSKKSSKKKKSKSGSRSPPIICSKAEHGKDVLKVQEKEAPINLMENTSFAEDNSNQSSEKSEDLIENSKPCNNSESLEPKTQTETNSVKECGDYQGNAKPTCNGSATNESNEIPETNEIQRLKSKLEEASLKQSLLNGFGNGEDLDKTQHDALIQRAEFLLENSGKDLDKVLKSPRIRRKSEEFTSKERTCRLSMDPDADTEPSEKPCINHIVNGDIPEKSDKADTVVNATDSQNLDGESRKDLGKDDVNSPADQGDSKTSHEELMDHMDSKKDRDSESDSGIVLNERTGFMHDGTGAIIALAVGNADSNKMSSQVAFCRDIREHLPADMPMSDLAAPTLESNTNNNSNPSLCGAEGTGETTDSVSQEDPMEGVVCPALPKPQQQAGDTSNQSSAPLNTESSTSSETNSENSTLVMSVPVVQGQVPQTQTQAPSSTSANAPSINSRVATPPPPSKPTPSSEIKSEKSSSSKSSSKKSSGKRSRHSSRESSSSKKRRRSSSSSGSSHHKKSSSSSSDKSKHHHHHHHQSSQQQQAQHQVPVQQQPAEAEICICDWRGCKRNFKTRKSLHVHASTVHVMGPAYRGMCEWENCDNIQRQRWSCVSHMSEKHCTDQALRAAAEKRQQASTPTTTAGSTPQLPTPILYNAHTAYHAIRRSLHSPSLKDLLGESEGPVTKSIRITAALVLKNLATYSADARSSLRRHEIHLARLAISNFEASSTLAKCVGELNDTRHLALSSDDEDDS
ncbi:AT-rich interactive domain-containing protein 2-like [Patiria miniata]|uniref:AT-rich interactive domain-containing protein 2 n=1 Tax=Patiria miniata TaxID=46514 RepID=A0A914AQW4_PATMI|nr:AT-rich interactive domain-containing protein 2-like [Patiria miniata]